MTIDQPVAGAHETRGHTADSGAITRSWDAPSVHEQWELEGEVTPGLVRPLARASVEFRAVPPVVGLDGPSTDCWATLHWLGILGPNQVEQVVTQLRQRSLDSGARRLIVRTNDSMFRAQLLEFGEPEDKPSFVRSLLDTQFSDLEVCRALGIDGRISPTDFASLGQQLAGGISDLLLEYSQWGSLDEGLWRQEVVRHQIDLLSSDAPLSHWSPPGDPIIWRGSEEFARGSLAVGDVPRTDSVAARIEFVEKVQTALAELPVSEIAEIHAMVMPSRTTDSGLWAIGQAIVGCVRWNIEIELGGK